MRSIAGATILVTRSRDDCEEWARELVARGARAVVLPCIEAERIDTPELRGALREALEQCDWLVFTSRRGVAAFAQLRAGAPLPPQVRVATVGPATGDAAERLVGRTDLVGGAQTDRDAGTAAALARQLAPRLEAGRRRRVLLALAENAGPALERELASSGVQVTRLNVYRTVPAPPREPKRALSALGADNIFFASPSAVTGFVNQIRLDARAAVFAIGPSTAARARELGLTVTGQAREPSLAGLLEALTCPT